jgi:hypothetical protein
MPLAVYPHTPAESLRDRHRARDSDHRPIDAAVQIAAQPVVREEGVQLGQQGKPTAKSQLGRAWRELEEAEGAAEAGAAKIAHSMI